MTFLPATKEEMRERGWKQPDFVLVTGDAYVDHPSFGTAIIGRVLERYGYKVAVLPQPGWRDASDFQRFGRPRLGFLINGGNVDSMVNHFSVNKNRRRTDKYSPGGRAGKRPDRAVIVYSNRAREAYRGIPVIIGGLEASLRRFGHYDFWEDKIRRSILLDSRADLLIYGMGEKAVVEIADALNAGIDVEDIGWIRGTCLRAGEISEEELKSGDAVMLPSFEEICDFKEKYAESFLIQYQNQDPFSGKRLMEMYDDHTYVIQNPPQEPLEGPDLDDIYELPYEGTFHPSYEKEGGVPAIEEVRFSITKNRGCFGGCAFCALTYHQGKQVRSRSEESIVREAKKLSRRGDFKGYIHDVGGPTANFSAPSCAKQLKDGICSHRDCLYPKPCNMLRVDHGAYLKTLRRVRNLPGVKKVFIRSGLRYDYIMADPDDTFLKELCRYHVSGTLKVAPEHISPKVLASMRKPPIQVFEDFSEKYKKINQSLGKKQYLIPYFISSHPGSTLNDAVDLALYLAKAGFIPDQVQDFYPTPGTLSTCMYYTETDPFTKEKIYVAKTSEEKRMQRALLHFNKRENRVLVEKALNKVGRKDEFIRKTVAYRKRKQS